MSKKGEVIDIEALSKNPQLQAMLQEKLSGVIGSSSGYIESLPTEVQKRIKALKKLHSAHLDIETEFQNEINELERKYLAKYQPLYEKRADIASGKHEPTEEECDYESENEDEDDEEKAEKSEKKDEKKEEKKEDSKDEKSEPVSGIPKFWLTALSNSDIIREKITEADEPILVFLKDIKIVPLTENPGFTLEFYFGENEWFSNEKLTKTYHVTVEKGGDMSYTKAEGCEITWKPNKNITVKQIKKVQRHKKTGTKRTITQTVPVESFFDFFKPPTPKEPSENEDEEAEEGEEGEEDTDSKLANDFEMGETLKTQIIPHAVQWFTGEALDYDDEDYDYEDDDEEGDDEEGDEDDDEEVDADFDPKKAQKPAECKQQ